MSIITIMMLCFVYFAYMIFTFELFEDNNDNLKVINIIGKPYKISLYRINGNTTVQSGIQVREVNGDIESTLIHYDRYDSVISY